MEKQNDREQPVALEEQSCEHSDPDKCEFDATSDVIKSETDLEKQPEGLREPIQSRYDWCPETNQWVEKPDGKYTYEDGKLTYTNGQGITYHLEKETNTWTPKIDDNFIAFYQMSYGFQSDTDSAKPAQDDSESQEEAVTNVTSDDKKRKTEPSWFDVDDDHNTKVYVSNLPEDITEQEFIDFMQKCGLVMKDPSTNKMKIKLYTDPEHNCLKGDALCTYIKIESVELALKILDGYLYHGKVIKVERAKFQMKGDYNPSLKPRKKRKKDLEKVKKMQDKLFDWRPDKLRGERAKRERTVIIKNVFDPKVFEENGRLISEYQDDISEECKKCGEVRKVVVYDRHPEGVVQVNMKTPEDADKCIQLLNNRWFEKRQLKAAAWDGKTKYKNFELGAESNKRLDERYKFFNEGEEDKSMDDKKSVSINKD